MNRDSAVSPSRALRRRRHDASGFALIEAIVASAIFAMIVLGVLAGIDGAAGSSGREKARSVAGTLAEQDQERMRGMRAIDLSNYAYNRDVVVGGATYKIDSTSEWIRDSTGGTISCVSSSTQADYLRIRTAVTSTTVGNRTAPVVIDSLVAPPVGAVGNNQGTLAVQVNDRNAAGVPNVPVKITLGSFTMVENTNAVGCAVFAYVPVGSYDVNVKQPGKVNPLGINDVHVSGTVTNGTTNLTKIDYDTAGAVNATFKTRYYDPSTLSVQEINSRAFSFMLDNNGVPGTSYRQFVPTSPPQNQIGANQLFPFKDAYGLFSGKCRDENPTVANGGIAQIVDPGQIYTVNIYQPSLRIRVRKSDLTPLMGGNVEATFVPSTSCAGGDFMDSRGTVGLTTYTGTGASDLKAGYVTRMPATGIPYDPSLPWGTWDICADDGAGRKATTRITTSRMMNPTLLLPAVTTLTLPSTTNGSC